MRTADFKFGTIYAYEKDSHSDAKPVLALDNKLWVMGDRSGMRYKVEPAKKGERPNDGHWSRGASTSRCGVPVLRIDAVYGQFTDQSHRAEYRVVETPAEIFDRALEQMGITSPADLDREFSRTRDGSRGWNPSGVMSPEEKAFRSTEVVVTRGDGAKGSVRVHLTTVRPQTVSSDWETFDEDKRAEAKAKAEYAKARAEKEAREQAANQGLKARLDALLGEVKPRWSSSDEREDCYRGKWGTFSIDEATLLRLLELAEKGAGQ